MTDRVSALLKLRMAIENKGPNPEYHDAQLARLRVEWPTLYEAIEAVLAATASEAV